MGGGGKIPAWYKGICSPWGVVTYCVKISAKISKDGRDIEGKKLNRSRYYKLLAHRNR